MVLESLSEALRSTLRKIAHLGRVDEESIKEVVRDVQRALLKADVNVKLVLNVTKNIEKRSLSEKVPPGMNPREHVIRILYEELVNVMGDGRTIPLKKQRIMLVGVYGQGKTTSAAKIARYLRKKGLKVGLLQADTHRPGAYDQLKQLAESTGAPFYGEAEEKSSVKLVKRLLPLGEKEDVLIIDTSGRHRLEKDLIDEMRAIAKVAKPEEKLLVVDSTMGQAAGEQAKAFHEAIGLTGVVLTKIDGSAKGGGALSSVAETGAQIVFVGTGEKLDDIETFDPTRFVSRLLGMGDLRTLLEKAQEAADMGKAEETAKKIMSGKFTLRDMYDQMETVMKMGSLKKIIDLLPVKTVPRGADMEQSQALLKKFKVIMDSMTEAELEEPRIVKSSRIKRIAKGAGVKDEDVKLLLRQYNASKKAVKGVMSNRRARKALMKQLSFEDY
jgi:signal recognition particle subunit SRP54